ncbi:MAG: GC-type dockerin domain-anchored protein [Phycisphaerales bacterium]|nr:GC-type dockerin domain-anchored protein [Phycisphaerales bacterium]
MRNKNLLTACTLVAIAGSAAGAQVIDWAAPVDGNWNDTANWLGANVPNSAGEDAVLGLAGAYTVTQTDSFVIGSLILTNPLAVLEIGNNRTLTLNGDLNNNGTVTVNFPATIFNTHISFAADATISGNGSILLNALGDPGDAQILANAFTVTHSGNHLIHGSGTIAGAMLNSSDIIADDPMGSGLRIAGTLTQSASGNAGADAGTMLLGSNSVTTGGELITINGGQILVENTVTIGDLTNSGDINIRGDGDFLALNASIQNNGTISINSDSSIFNAHLRFDVASSLNGSGTVIMHSNGDLADAQILTAGMFEGTIGGNQTVEGSGLITGATDGTIVNNGIINGNDPLVAMGLAGNHDGSGGGVYRSDGGSIDLRSGLILDGGTFDSSAGGIIEKTTNGSATISNITNNGEMGIRGQGGFVSLMGPMINNGNLTINNDNAIFNAHLRFTASTSVDGSGTITMISAGSVGDAQVYTDGLFTGTLGSNQTVQGSGQIDGRSAGTIVNNGTINGNHAAVDKTPARELRLSGNHNGSGGGVYRSDDGLLGLGSGLILDGGTFDSSGVGIAELTTNGIATLSNITNLGEMGVRGQGGSITLMGPMMNEGNVTLNTDLAIFNAHLRFGTTTTIDGSGTITMIAAGNLNDAQLFTDGEFTGTIGVNQTIQGSGQVDGRSAGTIVNNGTINGNDPALPLEIRGAHTGAGDYRSDNGLLALINGASLDGGTFNTSGTGSVEMTTNGIVTLSNFTNLGEMGIRGQGGIIELPTSLINNNNIAINPDLAIFNAHIRFTSDSAIDGSGTINMTTAGNSNDAQIIASDGFVGTIGSGQMLSGDGLLVGELNIDGDIDPAGLLRSFLIDTMHFSSTTTMTADLGGLLANEYDRLILAGSDTIDIDGELTVNLDSGYLPVFGDSWNIIDGGTISGEFATVNVPNAPLGQTYRVIYEADRVFVVLTCDADYTGDNVLNFFDVSKFLSFFNAQDSRADINGDGAYNFFDISLFLQIFNTVCE